MTTASQAACPGVCLGLVVAGFGRKELTLPVTLRIAVSGKGGVGKTTLAGTLARCLARHGLSVLAVDCDASPNLALTIGLGRPEEGGGPEPLPPSILERHTGPDGQVHAELVLPVREIIRRYGVVGPDGVMCLTMARVDHAGAG